jgi:hypothetical protein
MADGRLRPPIPSFRLYAANHGLTESDGAVALRDLCGAADASPQVCAHGAVVDHMLATSKCHAGRRQAELGDDLFDALVAGLFRIHSDVLRLK